MRTRAVTCRTTSAFTLVEVMLASVISIAIVLVLATTTTGVGDSYRRLSGELDRNARVRLVLDLISNDLKTAVIRQDDNTWLAIDVLNDATNSGKWVRAGGEKPSLASLKLDPKPRTGTKFISPEDYRFGQGGMWIRFFTSAEDRTIFLKGRTVHGDVNAVAYQMIRSNLATAPTVRDPSNIGYQLFRSIVRSDLTFKQGYDITTYTEGDEQGMPGEIKKPHDDSVVTPQVIDLGFIVWQRNAKGDLVQGFPNRDPSLPQLTKPNAYRAPQDGMPERADVFVRVISTAGATEMRTRELADMSGEQWWALAYKESRVFTRGILFPKTL